MKSESNYYELLEVAPTATAAEIRSAFQKAKLTYSNDNPALYGLLDSNEADDILKRVEEAYFVLRDNDRRAAYDQHLDKSKTSAPQTQEALETIPSANVIPEVPVTWSQDNPFLAQNPAAPVTDSMADSITAPLAGHVTFASTPAFAESEGSEEDSDDTSLSRTRLSTYKRDEEFEERLAQQEVFDGTFLKQIREYKNIHLTQINHSTRVQKKHLEAIEENNYTALPSPVFVRGFIRQIAKILELDEKKVSDSYMKLMVSSLSK